MQRTKFGVSIINGYLGKLPFEPETYEQLNLAFKKPKKRWLLSLRTINQTIILTWCADSQSAQGIVVKLVMIYTIIHTT